MEGRDVEAGCPAPPSDPRPPIRPHLMRILAVAAWLLAAFALARAADLVIAQAETSPMRLLARLAWAAALAYVGWRAWRAPRRRHEKTRRRVLGLLEVLSDPELQRAWAETAPQVSVTAALLGDFERATRSLDHEAGGPFPESARRELLAVRSAALECERSLPPEDDPAAALGLLEHPTWQDLVERAASARERLRESP